jgi:predicted transcriptional regulator
MPIIPGMSVIKGTSQDGELRFSEGEIAREIALLGLSRKEFCERAQITDKTLARAIRGERLHSKSWGKILIGLGARPTDASELVRTA